MARLNKSFKVPPIAKHRAPVDVARSYAAHGVPVFPCRSSEQYGIDGATGEAVTWCEKSPHTGNGLKGATRSSRIIDIFFGERHTDALIGVPTGESLGAWVLDIDKHGERDGYRWLAEMEARHGPLPETARATTANGGTHIFFKHVDGIRNRAAIAEGVDTRGEGGYVIAPGSVMADGRRYSWIDWDQETLPAFADAPQWLLDLLKPVEREVRTPTSSANTYTYKPSGNAPYVERAIELELTKLAGEGEGRRGHQLFASSAAIGEFVAAGVISRHEAESLLYDAAISCGVEAKDGQRKTVDRINRGLDKSRGTPREIPEPSGFDDDGTRPVNVQKILEGFRRKGSGEPPEPANDDTPGEGQPKPKRARFELTWFDAIEESAPKEMFIKGVLGNGEFTTISGLPGTGKSVIVTDAACHVAAGKEWHGRRVKQGLVIYVAAERKKLTERRMMAFRKTHGVRDVPLLVIGGRLDFTKDLKDAKDLIAAIRIAEEEADQKCVWVIIDTLTRVFGAGDQNASKDMGRFVQSCDEIATETTAHVTAIHHSAWSGERGKGAIDLDGAVDASFMVKKANGKYKLVCDGTNDGEEGTILAFKMDSVTLSVDSEGEATTAPVVVAVSDKEPGQMTSGGAKGYTARALQALSDAVEKFGIKPDGPHYPDGILVVKEGPWRDEYYDMEGDAASGDVLRKRFQRARKDLLSSKQAKNIGEWFWAA